MRMSFIVPALVCCIAGAQTAPEATESLVQRFNQALPEVNQLMNSIDFSGALVKANALLPAELPAFNGKDGQTIGKSIEDARGIMAIFKLQSTVLAASGEWEKAEGVQQKRLDYAKAFEADFNKGMEPMAAQWTKVVTEGKEYIAANEAKLPELEGYVAKVQEDIKNHNEKKVVMDKKAMEELQKVRIPKAQESEQLAGEIKAKIAGYKDAFNRQAQFTKWVDGNRQDVAGLVKESQEGLEKIQTTLKGQKTEIETFNAEQLKKNKKFKATGAQQWVEAVMNDKGNVTKLEGARNQAQFLNRLAVLSPNNKVVAKALDNLKAGKEPFFVEKKGKKGARK